MKIWYGLLYFAKYFAKQSMLLINIAGLLKTIKKHFFWVNLSKNNQCFDQK